MEAFCYSAGVTLLLTGWAISNKRNLLVHHFSLACQLVGFMIICIIVIEEWQYHSDWASLPLIFLALVLCSVTRQRSASFFFALCALWLSSHLLFTVFPHSFGYTFLQIFSGDDLPEALSIEPVTGILVYSGLGLLTAQAWTEANRVNIIKKIFPRLPLAESLLAFLLLIDWAGSLFDTFLPLPMTGVCSGFGACVALTLILRSQTHVLSPALSRSISPAVFIASIFPSLLYPFIGVALLCLLCARLRNSSLLYTICTVYLTGWIAQTCLTTKLNLLDKSYGLLCTGCYFFVCAYAIAKYTAKKQWRGYLPTLDKSSL